MCTVPANAVEGETAALVGVVAHVDPRGWYLGFTVRRSGTAYVSSQGTTIWNFGNGNNGNVYTIQGGRCQCYCPIMAQLQCNLEVCSGSPVPLLASLAHMLLCVCRTPCARTTTSTAPSTLWLISVCN